MFSFYAQYGGDGVVFSVIESFAKPEGENVIECAGYDVLGKKWTGAEFIDVPRDPVYKVWSKPEFILILGLPVFNAINQSTDEELIFYKYVLDNAPHVDLNVPEFRAMIDRLFDVGLIDQQKLDALLVQE